MQHVNPPQFVYNPDTDDAAKVCADYYMRLRHYYKHCIAGRVAWDHPLALSIRVMVYHVTHSPHYLTPEFCELYALTIDQYRRADGREMSFLSDDYDLAAELRAGLKREAVNFSKRILGIR
jgi:hypothetical protein